MRVKFRAARSIDQLITIMNSLNVSKVSFNLYYTLLCYFHPKKFCSIGPDMTVSYALGVPFSLIATYLVLRFGLKLGVYIGGILTFLGGLLCCLSTLPGLFLRV